MHEISDHTGAEHCRAAGGCSYSIAPLTSSPASIQVSSQLDRDSFHYTVPAADTDSTGISFPIIPGTGMVGREIDRAVMNSEGKILVTLTNENEADESDAVTLAAFTDAMEIMSML